MSENDEKNMGKSQHWRGPVWGVGLLVGIVGFCSSQTNLIAEETPFDLKAVTFFEEYCLDCHSNDRQKADINLETFRGEVLLYKEPKFWQRVVEVIETREMPPEKKPQPSTDERFAIAAFLRAELKALDCSEAIDPGRVTIRRLNKNEYNNTIQDLFNIDLTPADAFPSDEVGYGFDNIADVLSIPPILMEKYLEAGETIAKAAIMENVPPWPPSELHQAEEFVTRSEDIRPARDRYLGFYREGSAFMEFEAKEAGDYVLKIKTHGDQAGPEAPKLSVKVGSGKESIFEVPQHAEEAVVLSLKAKMKKGNNRLYFAYLNNFVNNNFEIPELSGDRNLFVDWVQIEGPMHTPKPVVPHSHSLIIPEKPRPGTEIITAKKILRDFATRALRRPATNDEVVRLTELATLVLEDGGSFEEGIQLAVQALISSPKFLFRWELDRGLMTDEELAIRNINGYEIASRLSFFIWNSMPDKKLFELADSGQLVKPEVLEAQIDRMLKDKKAKRFIVNFAGQWLQIRNLDTHSPDPSLFPVFTPELRASMKKETELLCETIMIQDLSLKTLLDSDFTFVNKALAKHYGFPEPEGDGFSKVLLPQNSPRGGVLTQGSILTITSNPTRTSPVVRGKWILEQILGTPPPPPPPNVPELEESKEASETASLRERLEIHRDKPDCAGCHAKMDPLGFAFENFDAIGRWREFDEHFKIDPSGNLPDGTAFNGPGDLKAYLLSGDTFIKALTENMLTYALGRGLEYYDQCAIEKIVNKVKNTDYKFSSLIKGIVFSDPFLKRSVMISEDE